MDFVEKVLVGKALIIIYTLITWVVNLIKFVKLDFTEWSSDILIHGLGVFIFPVSWVTAWL